MGIKENSIEYSEQTESDFNAYCEQINCKHHLDKSKSNERRRGDHAEQAEHLLDERHHLDIYTNNNNNNNSIIITNSDIIEETCANISAHLHSKEGRNTMNEKEHGACGGGDDTTAATSDKITYNETFFNDANQSNNSNFK